MVRDASTCNGASNECFERLSLARGRRFRRKSSLAFPKADPASSSGRTPPAAVAASTRPRSARRIGPLGRLYLPWQKRAAPRRRGHLRATEMPRSRRRPLDRIARYQGRASRPNLTVIARSRPGFEHLTGRSSGVIAAIASDEALPLLARGEVGLAPATCRELAPSAAGALAL